MSLFPVPVRETPDIAAKSPGFPHPKPCLSYWLQQTRASPLLGHRSTNALPDNVEVVIIGSGMSGAATAYFALTGPNPPKSVLILEAREACYGATGRNGGHCRPDCYRGYPGYKSFFGKEQAMKILRNEMDTLNLVEELVKKENIDCDFWRGRSLDVAMDEQCADTFLKAYNEFKADGGELEGIVEWVSDPQEAKKRTRCASATAAAEFPAGSFYPYKFVQHILLLCLEKHGLNLQTSTVVKSAEQSQSSSEWTVNTDRGAVRAKKIVFATNAFTGTLLPEFIGKLTPFRGQCSAFVPTRACSGKDMLSRTASYRFGWGDFDYMIQRPQDAVIIIGGGRWRVPLEKLMGNTDDSEKIPELSDHLSKTMGRYVEAWGEERVGEGMLWDWTGIMGYTYEGIPFLGEVPNRPSGYINAGHCGHGMARILTCSRGIAALLRGESWDSTGLPECFQPSKERMEREESVEAFWCRVRAKQGDRGEESKVEIFPQ